MEEQKMVLGGIFGFPTILKIEPNLKHPLPSKTLDPNQP